MGNKVNFNKDFVNDGLDDSLVENYGEALTQLTKVLSFFDEELKSRGMDSDARGNLVHMLMIYLLDDGFFLSNNTFNEDDDEAYQEFDD